MSVEENKALMRRWFEEVNKGKAAAMVATDELHSADIVRYRGSGEEIHGARCTVLII